MKGFAIFFSVAVMLILCSCSASIQKRLPPIIELKNTVEKGEYDTAIARANEIIASEDSNVLLEPAYIYLAYCQLQLGEKQLSDKAIAEGYAKTKGKHISYIGDGSVPLDIAAITADFTAESISFRYSKNSKLYMERQQYTDGVQKTLYYTQGSETPNIIDTYDGKNNWRLEQYSTELNRYIPKLSTTLDDSIYKTTHYTEDGSVDYIIHSWALEGEGEALARYTASGSIVHEKEITQNGNRTQYREYDKAGNLLFTKIELKTENGTVTELYSASGKLGSRLETTVAGDTETRTLYDAENVKAAVTTVKNGDIVSEEVFHDKSDGGGIQYKYIYNRDGSVKAEKYSEAGKLLTYTVEYTKDGKKYIEYREADGKLASTNIIEIRPDGSWSDISIKPDGIPQREQLGTAEGDITEKYYNNNGTLTESGTYTKDGHSIQRFSDKGIKIYNELYSSAENQREIRLFYDNLNIVKSHMIIYADGSELFTTYRQDGTRQLEQIKKPDGTLEEYYYSQAGGLIFSSTIIYADGSELFTTYRQDGTRQLEQIKKPDGTLEEYYYSQAGGLIFSSTGNVSERKAIYYSNGFVQKYAKISYNLADGEDKYTYFDSNNQQIDEKTFKSLYSDYELVLKSDESLNNAK